MSEKIIYRKCFARRHTAKLQIYQRNQIECKPAVD
jgi:hypothetical protein